MDAFYFKKIIKKKFDNIFFLRHLIKSFLIFVSFFFLFWVDSHSNIFIEPFQIIKRFLNDLVTGWPYNLTNGIYFESSDTPLNYYFVNIFFKSPEYIIISYCIFFLFFIFKNNYFSKRIIEFNYKIYFISFVILFPTFVIYIISFPIYDGLRLFLWSVAYISIIPAILLDYLLKHKDKYKFIITSFFFLFVYFFVKFLTISPYHYTYVNSFVGNKEVSKMFENDYWGISLNELIQKINLEKNLEFKISTCGIEKKLAEKYLKKNNFKKVIFVSYDEADFVIMNNRTFNPYGDNKNITNCLLHFDGVDLASVKRNDVTLSVFRQIRK